MPPGALAPADTTEPNAAAAKTRGALNGGTVRPAEPPDGDYFTVDPVFLGAAAVVPYQRQPDDPVYRPLRIFALDPSASRLDGAVATINLPYEKLEPGPCGAVLEVVDWDETTGTAHPPIDLDNGKALIRNGQEPSVSDVQFHQQMAYAVCASTYNVFRSALGRDPSWGFLPRPGEDRPILRIRPHACLEENAYYQPRIGELCFGYYDAAASVSGRNLPFGRIYTCLSHDIVVHEMTHALLDGLRRHFMFPTHPDVPAFHEAFADLVAIFRTLLLPRRGARGDRALERRPGAGRSCSSPSPRSSGRPPARAGRCAARSTARACRVTARADRPTSACGGRDGAARTRLRPRLRGVRGFRHGFPAQGRVAPPPRAACAARHLGPRAGRCAGAGGEQARAAIPVDLRARHRLLPAGGPAFRRVPARHGDRRLRPGPGRPAGLPGSADRRLRPARHLP